MNIVPVILLQVRQVHNRKIRQKKLLQNPVDLRQEVQTRSLNFHLTCLSMCIMRIFTTLLLLCIFHSFLHPPVSILH